MFGALPPPILLEKSALTMDAELAGRRALVTGGARGIGGAIAAALAGAGARVAIGARSADQVQQMADQIAETGAETLALELDVSKADSVARSVDAVQKAWGGVDILVNNAGVLGPIGLTESVDAEAWLETIQINLGGCFLCTHACLPSMTAQGQGRIINLSGGGAVSPRPRFSAYGASKAAIVRFTETLAAEVADTGIQVNAIAPGAVNTHMTQVTAEAGDPAGEEAAAALRQLQEGGADVGRPAQLALFLASSRSDGITGRLFHAVWDDWEQVQAEEIRETELYTVRRLKPELQKSEPPPADEASS